MSPSRFTVVYDACVLYPAPLRDFLVRLGTSGTFRARWSAQIHDEWKRNLLLQRADLTREQLDRIASLMDEAVPDGPITGHEGLIAGLALPDPDDRHVLAAAIRARADVIVTFNLKDFPGEVLAQFGVEAQHPDEFVDHLFRLHPAAVVESARQHRLSLKKPPMDVDQYLACFNARHWFKQSER